MQWIQLIIPCSRQLSGDVESAALEAGALSVTLQDAADQPILEPAVGETPLWDDCVMTALFSSETDTKSLSDAHKVFFGPPPRAAARGVHTRPRLSDLGC